MVYLKYIIFISLYKYTYEVQRKFSHLSYQHFLQEAKIPTKTQEQAWGTTFLSCWSVLSKRPPKHTAYFYCPWLPPEVEGEFLLLKTPRISDMGPDTEKVLTWKPSPWGQAFMVLEGIMQASEGGKSPIIPPRCDAWELQPWQYSRVTLRQ